MGKEGKICLSVVCVIILVGCAVATIVTAVLIIKHNKNKDHNRGGDGGNSQIKNPSSSNDQDNGKETSSYMGDSSYIASSSDIEASSENATSSVNAASSSGEQVNENTTENENLESPLQFKLLEKTVSHAEGYPFTLSFSNQIMPTALYSAFETVDSPEKINIDVELDYNWKNYMLESERNIGIGIDLGFDSDIMKKIAGKFFDILKIVGELKNFQENNNQQILVNHYVKKYTINLDKNEISLKKSFLDDISNILKGESYNLTESTNNEENTNNPESTEDRNETIKKLINLFDNYGYFVPLQIDLGGRFMYYFEESDTDKAREISLNIIDILKGTLDEDKILSYCERLSVRYIGGEEINNFNNMSVINEWMNSLEENNLGIVNYHDLVSIPEFLPNDLKTLYDAYDKEISDRYLSLFEKYETLKNYINIEVPSGDQSAEETKEFNYGAKENDNYVQVVSFKIQNEASLQERTEVTKRYDCEEKQIIVGFKIVEEKEGELGGSWTVKENPILGTSIEVLFKSGINSEQDWSFYVYYIDFN